MEHSVSLKPLAGLCFAIGLASLSGCEKYLDLSSDPAGAVVTEEGTGNKWIAPTRLSYSLAYQDQQGCVVGKPLMVTWSSGAQRSYTPRLCGAATNYSETIARPAGAPGRAQDLAVERDILARAQQNAQLTAIREQQAMNEAAQSIGRAIGQAAAGGGGGSTPPYWYDEPRPSPESCYSEVIGSSIYTRCR